MNHTAIDFSDVQGIVRFGYGRLTEASYTLLRIKDAGAARAWLRSAPIGSAVTLDSPPQTALQVAFTAEGLKALGLSPAALAAFSPEFLGGMTEDNRARRLGDVGDNDSKRWDWGGTGRVPHIIVMCFAGRGRLAGFERDTRESWQDAFVVQRVLGTGDLDGVEPFGFADGISQPHIDWSQTRKVSIGSTSYSNVVALGEFLLGYRNEYNQYTDRPLLDANEDSAGLPRAEDAPDKKDLGRNGSYLVVRTLEQDVRTFWRFLHDTARGDPDEADRIAAAFVGRTKSGDPLVPIQSLVTDGSETHPREARQNQFTFDQDPSGFACPIGAHVRRANPRNSDIPGNPSGFKKLLAALGLGRNAFLDDLTSPVRFHRILRRGREFGPGLSPADALQPAPPDEPARGLHFLCLNANISRQFEFLQNGWMASTKFAGLSNESDPLLGHREAIPGCPVTNGFTLPRKGAVRRRISGLPQFVHVRGGAYFFLPGLRALQYIARDGAT